MTAARSATRGPRPDDPHATLRLAPGVELLGESPDSGFSHPRYLLRRPDGQVVLVSGLLYLVADALAEHDRPADVARIVTNQVGRAVSAADVEHLAVAKLQPIGVIAPGNDNPATDDALPRVNPLLTLGLRVGFVPERLRRTLTTALRPLFRPSVVVVVLIALALVDAWLAAHSSVLVDASLQVAAHPSLVVAVTALVLISLAFHEIGHATACCYGAGRPATRGVGVYGVWPAFSTHVTGAYGLDGRGRLRTDLGGVYFNAVFALVAAALYAASSFEPLLGAAVLAQMQALYQLLPFVRLDGYHILGDLARVPNLFAYLRAAALTLLPVRRGTPPEPSEFCGGSARVPVSRSRAWVAMTVPLLVINLTVAAYLALRTVPVLWQSVQAAGVELAAAAQDGRWLTAMGIAVQLVLVAFPLMGCAILLARAGQLFGWRVAAMGRSSLDRLQPLLRSSSVLLPLTLVLCAALLCAVVGLTISGQRDGTHRAAPHRRCTARRPRPPRSASTATRPLASSHQRRPRRRHPLPRPWRRSR